MTSFPQPPAQVLTTAPLRAPEPSNPSSHLLRGLCLHSKLSYCHQISLPKKLSPISPFPHREAPLSRGLVNEDQCKRGGIKPLSYQHRVEHSTSLTFIFQMISEGCTFINLHFTNTEDLEDRNSKQVSQGPTAHTRPLQPLCPASRAPPQGHQPVLPGASHSCSSRCLGYLQTHVSPKCPLQQYTPSTHPLQARLLATLPAL